MNASLPVVSNSPQNSLKTYKQAELDALAYVKGRMEGTIRSLITPWTKFNEAHIDGIEMNQIVTIAGMSSSGKSALSGQLERDLFALNPNEDFLVLSFNFEMPSRDIVIRNLIAETGINQRELLSADGIMLGALKFEMLRVKIEEIDNHVEIYYVEYPKTVEQYKMICRKFYEKYRKKFITISDHSVLFKRGATEASNTETLYALGDASIELKKELPVTQVHLSQLNREIEKIERRTKWSPYNFPSKDCLFGADALYQCADTVLINHRPFLLNFPVNGYGPDKLPTGPNDLYWHFLKIRNGTPHLAMMEADFANMKIMDKL